MKKLFKRITSIVCMMALIAGLSITYVGSIGTADAIDTQVSQWDDGKAAGVELYTPNGTPALEHTLYAPKTGESYEQLNKGQYLNWNFNIETDLAKSTAKEITWLKVEAELMTDTLTEWDALKNAEFYLSNQTIDEEYIVQGQENKEEIENIFKLNSLRWDDLAYEDDVVVYQLTEENDETVKTELSVEETWSQCVIELWVPFTQAESLHETRQENGVEVINEETKYDLSAKNNAFMLVATDEKRLEKDGNIELHSVSVVSEMGAEFGETEVIGPGGTDMQDPYLKLNYPLSTMPKAAQAAINVERQPFLAVKDMVSEGKVEAYTLTDEEASAAGVVQGTVVAKAVAASGGTDATFCEKTFVAKNFSVNNPENIVFSLKIYNGTGSAISTAQLELTSVGAATAYKNALLYQVALAEGWNDIEVSLKEFQDHSAKITIGQLSGQDVIELSKVDYFRLWNLGNYNVGEIYVTDVELEMEDLANITLVDVSSMSNNDAQNWTEGSVGKSNNDNFDVVAAAVDPGETVTLLRRGISWGEALDISDYDLSELSVSFWYRNDSDNSAGGTLVFKSDFDETVAEADRYTCFGTEAERIWVNIQDYYDASKADGTNVWFQWYYVTIPLSDFSGLPEGTTKNQILRFFQQEFNGVHMYQTYNSTSGSAYTVSVSDLRLHANDTDLNVYEEKLGRSILHCDSTDEVITPYYPSTWDDKNNKYPDGTTIPTELAGDVITQEAVSVTTTSGEYLEGNGAYVIEDAQTIQHVNGQLWEMTFARKLNLANYADGNLQFRIYISNKENWNGDLGISLSSLSNWNKDSVYWEIPIDDLYSGWNLISVDLDKNYAGAWKSDGTTVDSTSGYTIEWESIDYFRITQTDGDAKGAMEVRLDDVRVVEYNPMIFSNTDAVNDGYFGLCLTKSGYPAFIWGTTKFTLMNEHKDIGGKGWLTLHVVRREDTYVEFLIDELTVGMSDVKASQEIISTPQRPHCIGSDATGGQIFNGRIAYVMAHTWENGKLKNLDGWFLNAYTEEDDKDYVPDDGNYAGSLHNLQIDVQSMNGTDNHAGWRGVTVLGIDGYDTYGGVDVSGFRYTTGWFDEISAYRSDGQWSVPKKDGYIFAGWFTDSDCMTPIYDLQTSGEAWAKWVRVDLLKVKAQVLLASKDKLDLKYNTNDDNKSGATIRFVTSVDSDRYYQVGFKITANGVTEYVTNGKVVYEKLKALGKDNTYMPTTASQVFTTISEYFKAYTITGVTDPTDEFVVQPYYITLDGSYVFGDTKTISFQQYLIEAGAPAATWDTYWEGDTSWKGATS